MSRAEAEQSYHHGDLRPALLRSARGLIEERGPQGVSLREIARRVGVSAPAAYHHFRNLDALAQAVAEQGFAELGAALAAAQSDQGGFQAAMGRGYLSFALGHPGLYKLMFTDGMVAKGRIGSPLQAQRLRAFEMLRGALVTPFGEERARDIATYLWALVHGLAMLAIDGQLGEGDARDARIDSALKQVGATLPAPAA